MDPTTIHAVARRFPLLARPRPTCPTLADRITEVADTAAAAHAGGGIADAAHALNKAALIASDCGLPDLARQWCWQHINIYRQHDTLTARQAGYLLEPVLNLARLQIRANDGHPALALLQTMYQAVTTGTDLHIDGHRLPLANPTGTRDERHQLHRWTWLQHLNEGVRIHALAGRWDQAVDHATALNGIGHHLMEGRQGAIIAPLMHGDREAARTVLDASSITQPWEQQVAACLTVLCEPPNGNDRRIDDMVAQFLTHQPLPGYEAYRTRWGLTVATLSCNAADLSAAQKVIDQTVTEAVETGDGYAAREILGHRTTLHITPADYEALTRAVTASGLGARTIPTPTLDILTAAVDVAVTAMSEQAR